MLRLSRSIKNAFPFRQTMADYICSSSYFVAGLRSKIFTYYIKPRVHGVKIYSINGKKTLTGDWEELNKGTYM